MDFFSQIESSHMNKEDRAMNRFFTIGQLSKLFNIKIPTLRYYDEVGILKPEKVNHRTNYRYYSTQQFERLNVISYLRALDMPIEMIKDFFEARDIVKLEEMLKEQKIQIQNQIKTLEKIDHRIDARISQVEDATNSGLDKIEIVNLPEVAVIYLDENYRLNDDIELPITALRKEFGMEKNIFLGKIALMLSQDKLISGIFDNYDGLLLIMEPGDDGVASNKLKSGRYIRLRFHGTHNVAIDQYQKLLSYCQKHNFEINGPAIETALIDYGITDDLSKYVTEIRIPIKND